MTTVAGDPVARIAAWTRRWSAILPLLAAELIVWLGFGALLPVMPLYFTANGVDLATLGVVVAAWPAARLVGEPVFGWLADRVPRVPLMIAGNVLAGIFLFLPLVFVGAVPFIVLRALAGLATALYDPAARGYITDATPADRRREAFGLYGAAQMGGLTEFPHEPGHLVSRASPRADEAAPEATTAPRPAGSARSRARSPTASSSPRSCSRSAATSRRARTR